MEEQRSQLDACLPTTGEFRQWSFQIDTFDFELAGNFAAFPIGLTAVAHQELESRLARQERIVLSQIAKLQLRVPDDLASIELFFIQDHAEQCAFAGAIATHKTHFCVVGQCCLSAVEQHLVAITLECILDLQQHSHAVSFLSKSEICQ
jgi:hypothetical protein